MKHILSLLCAFALNAGAYTVTGNTYLTDGSQADVQAAINAAPDNGSATVQIPNGTYSWSNGITINKSIALAGADATGVTINNQVASGNLISASAGSNGHINIYQLKFVQVANNGGGAGFILSASRTESTSFTVLVHDCVFDDSQIYNYSVVCNSNGIVFWNDTFIGSGNYGLGGISMVVNGDYSYWNTPDYLGAQDSSGLFNTYVEDCTFSECPTACINGDENSRIVIRDNTIQNSTVSGHGQETSPHGAKAFEIYENTFVFNASAPAANSMQNWIFIRGGTGVIYNNSMDQIPYKGSICLNVFSITRGMNDGGSQNGSFCPLNYPAPRQTGWGWSASSSAYWGIGDDTDPSRLVGGTSPGVFAPDGTGAILDPLYIWGNTGYYGDATFTQTYTPDNCKNNQTIGAYLQQGRDYYVGVAKPGWSAYTYPHPLHTQYALGGGTGGPTPTPTPSATPTPTPSATPTPTPSATPTPTPPPPYSAWEAELFNELVTAGIGPNNRDKVETWVKANPPTP